MGYIATNGLAILLATVAGLLVGAATLAVPAFAMRREATPLVIAAVAAAEAWLCAILAGALILAPSAGPGPWVMALASAVVIWIGFVLPTTVVTGLHAGLGPGRIAGYAGHWLAVMLVQAAVLQAVGLAKPA